MNIFLTPEACIIVASVTFINLKKGHKMSNQRSGRSIDGDRFFKINSKIRRKIRELLDVPLKWPEYITSCYTWIPAFSHTLNFLENRKSNDYRDYFSEVPKFGLYEIWESPLSGIIPKTDDKGNKRKLFTIPNTTQNRKLGSDYLRRSFSELERNSNKSPGCLHAKIEDIIEAGLVGLAEYTAPKDAEKPKAVCSQFRNALVSAESEPLEILVGLLIYAQTGWEMTKNWWPNRYPSFHPNVYMGTKTEIQNKFSLQTRYQGASRLVIINFAGTSFLSGRLVDSSADRDWKGWFHNTMQGATEIRIVLTDPRSAAAKDAEHCKMRPKKLECELEEIIQNNLQSLREESIQYPNRNFKVYLTTVALPCAYIKAEFEEDHSLDNIKIDLYLPNFEGYKPGNKSKYEINDVTCSDDFVRQSFMIFRKDVPELYNSFSKNIEEILIHAEEVIFDTGEEHYDEIS